jgi:hypothetical protein
VLDALGSFDFDGEGGVADGVEGAFGEVDEPSPDEGDAALSDPDPDPLDSPTDAGDVSLLAEDALLAPVFLLSVL